MVDKFGPRFLIDVGAAMSGAGWIAASKITTLEGLYLTYGLLCGIGTGIVYIGIVGLMVKWFPDRRGLATGGSRPVTALAPSSPRFRSTP